MQHRESSGGGSGALRLTWSSRIRDRLHEASSLLSRGEKTRRVLIFLSPPSLFMTKHTTRAPTHARRTLKVGVALPPDTSASANYTVRFFDFFFLEIKKRQKILYNLPLSPAILLSLLSPPHSARVLHLETKTLWKECVLCTQCVYRPDSISWSSKLYLASSFFFFPSLALLFRVEKKK